MRCWISLTMSSKLRSSARLAVTSRYSASMMASRSPSSVIGAPVVVLIVRISGSEAGEGSGLVRVDLNEVLRAGHRQHGLDPLLNARQLQLAARGLHETVTVHQAADGGAVDVGDRRQVDQLISVALGD